MRTQAVLTIALVLFGCGADTRLSADTEESFDKSYTAMTNGLDGPARERLDAALRDIALTEGHVSKVELEAAAYQPDTSRSGFSSLNSAFAGVMDNALSAQWGLQRAKIVVKYGRAVVNGRTAAEILRIADDEKIKAIGGAIEIYSSHLEKTRQH